MHQTYLVWTKGVIKIKVRRTNFEVEVLVDRHFPFDKWMLVALGATHLLRKPFSDRY